MLKKAAEEAAPLAHTAEDAVKHVAKGAVAVKGAKMAAKAPLGHRLLGVAQTALGGGVMLVGAPMLVLPGPGLLLVGGGALITVGGVKKMLGK